MKNRQFKNFNSFFMGGFECADHINRSGKRVNLLKETEHDVRAHEDYLLLASLGIKVVREGICWSEVESSPYKFDFSSLKKRMDSASKLGIQIIWDLCHFGYPDGLIPTHPNFFERFMALCRAFALFHKSYSNNPLLVVPVNEISFLSWHSGDMRGTVPFAINSGFDIKYHLCKAAIEGIKVLKQTDPDCVALLVEPLIKKHSANEEISLEELEIMNSYQYQAMDIVLGRMCPELGGSPALADMLGFNYYYDNQSDHLNQVYSWPQKDKQLTPFSKLLLEAWQRYRKPVIVSETGHFGIGRSPWLEEITLECDRALSLGVDLKGICIYPVTDRPDWDNLNSYSNCGIFDLDVNKNRIPDEETVISVRKCIELIETRKSIDKRKEVRTS